MRCTLLASLAVAAAITAASPAHAENENPEASQATVPGDAGATEQRNATDQPDPTVPEVAAPNPPVATPREVALFSPRVVGSVLGVTIPTDAPFDVREPRGFLGARTTHLAVGWTLVGTGVLSGVAAGTLAWQASRPEVTPSAAPVGTAPRDDRAQQVQDRADKRAMANVMAGAGLAFLATGGITLLTAPAPRGGPNTRVGAMATPSGGYVGVTGKW